MDNNEQRDHEDEAATRRELEAEGEAELAEQLRDGILAAGGELAPPVYPVELGARMVSRLRALADFLERHPELPAINAPQFGRSQDTDLSGQPCSAGGRGEAGAEVARLYSVAQYARAQGAGVTVSPWTADESHRVRESTLLSLDAPAAGERYSLEVWTVVERATVDAIEPAPARELTDGAVELEAERRGLAGAVTIDTAGDGELDDAPAPAPTPAEVAERKLERAETELGRLLGHYLQTVWDRAGLDFDSDNWAEVERIAELVSHVARAASSAAVLTHAATGGE